MLQWTESPCCEVRAFLGRFRFNQSNLLIYTVVYSCEKALKELGTSGNLQGEGWLEDMAKYMVLLT